MATKAIDQDVDTIKVDIGAIGSEVKTVQLNGERTISAALAAAGFDSSLEVRVNGEAYSGSDTVEDGDNLIVVNQEKVKGANI